ncbi:hypothetical protein HZC09_06905 [Candidatus Micrarchaeota archaeon]|nr:hypothetical protein [Candidatus Micrarchaeota archaeon]
MAIRFFLNLARKKEEKEAEKAKRAFFNAIQDPFEVKHPGLVHALLDENKENHEWTINAEYLHFKIGSPVQTPGALLYILGLGNKKSKNDVSRVYTYPSELSLHTADGSKQYFAVAKISPENNPYNQGRFDKISAFGHLVLLRQGKHNILLLSCMQKVMSKVKSKRVAKELRTINRTRDFDDDEEHGWTSQDLHQMSQGPTRNYSMIDAALEIAERMRKLGVTVEVHAPHPEAINPPNDETGKRIKKPLIALQQHFKEDLLHETRNNYLKTINLSKAKTRRARELLSRIKSEKNRRQKLF